MCFQGSGAHVKRRNLCKDSCKFIKHLHLEGKFRLVVPQVIVTNFQDREEYKVWGHTEGISALGLDNTDGVQLCL